MIDYQNVHTGSKDASVTETWNITKKISKANGVPFIMVLANLVDVGKLTHHQARDVEKYDLENQWSKEPFHGLDRNGVSFSL